MNWNKYLLILCLLCLGFTACSDDDDSSGSEQGQTIDDEEWEEMEEWELNQCAILSVLGTLSGEEMPDTLNTAVLAKYYESEYGNVLDESDPNTRSVLVLNSEDAANIFCGLVPNNSNVTKETIDGYYIDLNNLKCQPDGSTASLGTLTFHKVGDGSNVGYAEVNIPQMPHLHRINYVTKANWPENARWESPCLWGQVWSYDGHYWLCVKESTGDEKSNFGWLVNVQPGKGTLSNNLTSQDGKKGAWDPKYSADKAATESFVRWLKDPDSYDIKRSIINKYPGKVIPYVPRPYNKDYTFTNYTNPDDGFGISRVGWVHWVGGDSPNYNDSKYYSPGDGPEVLIVRDSWMGSYNAGKMRHNRRMETYCMAPRHKESGSKEYWNTRSYCYTKNLNEGTFYSKFKEKYVYTLNAVKFWGTPPNGATLVFDPVE